MKDRGGEERELREGKGERGKEWKGEGEGGRRKGRGKVASWLLRGMDVPGAYFRQVLSCFIFGCL